MYHGHPYFSRPRHTFNLWFGPRVMYKYKYLVHVLVGVVEQALKFWIAVGWVLIASTCVSISSKVQVFHNYY